MAFSEGSLAPPLGTRTLPLTRTWLLHGERTRYTTTCLTQRRYGSATLFPLLYDFYGSLYETSIVVEHLNLNIVRSLRCLNMNIVTQLMLDSVMCGTICT